MTRGSFFMVRRIDARVKRDKRLNLASIDSDRRCDLSCIDECAHFGV